MKTSDLSCPIRCRTTEERKKGKRRSPIRNIHTHTFATPNKSNVSRRCVTKASSCCYSCTHTLSLTIGSRCQAFGWPISSRMEYKTEKSLTFSLNFSFVFLCDFLQWAELTSTSTMEIWVRCDVCMYVCGGHCHLLTSTFRRSCGAHESGHLIMCSVDVCSATK